jgi:UDP-N-acetylmuramoylalanine--D-glutamate ligase
MELHGRHFVVLGLARQGVALARYLARHGAHVTASDLKPAEALKAQLAELADLPIEYVLGEHPSSLLDRAEALFISGGVPADLPLAHEALRRGIPLSNDSQLFLERTPARVIGITGSAGKTTTTTLVGRMLKAEWGTPALALPTALGPWAEGARSAGASVRNAEGGSQPPGIHHSSFNIQHYTAWVGGNIGHPLLADLDQMRPGDLAVMELSSFQLQIMTVSPQIAAVLNVTPNHLDRHGTMETYAEAKSHILRHQAADGIAVLGLDDAGARGLASLARGRKLWFSGEAEVDEGAFRRGETLVLRLAGRETPVCAVRDVRLRGYHNLLNVLAACAIVGAAAGAADAPIEAMREAIATFGGVEHRLEYVRDHGGAEWYNDSIATAPERAAAAIRSFEEPIVLLAGGRDKKLPWDEFARLARRRVRHLVLFGEARELIEKAARREGCTAITLCEGLAQAVQAAAREARPGEVVLLAPGCTSFDEFADFAERGAVFKRLVHSL